TGMREEISKIVPFLKPGAAVTLSRADVDYVVTEYGCVSLRGTTVRERVELDPHLPSFIETVPGYGYTIKADTN
ncbi:MAG: hypothetical protein CVV58_07505, partial [Tenericutes bacterium HGW-Tenericutes-3]